MTFTVLCCNCSKRSYAHHYPLDGSRNRKWKGQWNDAAANGTPFVVFRPPSLFYIHIFVPVAIKGAPNTVAPSIFAPFDCVLPVPYPTGWNTFEVKRKCKIQTMQTAVIPLELCSRSARSYLLPS